MAQTFIGVWPCQKISGAFNLILQLRKVCRGYQCLPRCVQRLDLGVDYGLAVYRRVFGHCLGLSYLFFKGIVACGCLEAAVQSFLIADGAVQSFFADWRQGQCVLGCLEALQGFIRFFFK